MPDDLELYFLDQYPVEKAANEELRNLTTEVLRTFAASFLREPGSWPYQLENAKPIELPDRPSMSTTAMIAFALALATGAIRQSSLAPSIGDPLGSEKLRSVIRRFNRRAVTCVEAVARDLTEVVDRRVSEAGFPKPDPDPPLTDSATFGWDDPFTLSWLLEVLAGDDDAGRASFASDVCSQAEALITKVMAAPAAEVLQIPPGRSVTHAFPLLRALQLAHSVARVREVELSAVADTGLAREYLLRRVHLQLSESHIADGGFDAADLVFSLEGWILTSQFEPDLAVVDEVFNVLHAGQERTPYWRPLRPFEATPQGLILLPQSVEIANSLLRICNFPALAAREYFSRHLDLLQRYTRWLQGRVFRGQTSGPARRTFTGWESEHTYAQNRIHLWQTSQVLIFLHQYGAMLQQHIARKLLRLAPLVPLRPPARPPQRLDPVQAWKKWKQSEPLLLTDERSPYRVYQRIEDEFIAPRARRDAGRGLVSMVLYGPPGTGKSRLAEELARALGFPLLTVTPSDFLTAGGEAVEARAKAIFQVLAEQRDMVVLFDEIDNLLLDRDSDLYQAQGDVFKLLTPGMLTKLNDLAKQKRVIFAIATNYYERIDPAIKRPGRIDARYLVLPPDLTQRKTFLASQLTRLEGEELESAARSTVHLTYRELTDLVDHVRLRVKDDPSGTAHAVHQRVHEVPPMITLESYGRRVGLKWNDADDRTEELDHILTVERPWDELALLTFLEYQARGWPGDPLWLPDGVKEALKQGSVRDAEVVALLRDGMVAARGDDFLEDLPETSQ